MGKEERKRLTFPFLFPFIHLLCCTNISTSPSGGVAAADGDDGNAMSDLAKSLTNLPDDWTSGNPNFCKWSGVTCDSGRVTAINLPQRSISGHLPDSLSQLSSLRSISLPRNRISGPLPSFANMASLQSISLDSNAFTSLPPDIFSGLSSLQDVSLDDNPFSPWSIPDDLAKSDSLRDFSATNATVSGAIPDFLGRLPSLQDLRLSYNNLTGGLPSSFAASNLQNLRLNNQQSGEKLTGRIDVVGGMGQLSLLWLQSNSFSGPIPDLSNLTSLASFNVRDNQLTGVVPPSLSNCPTLMNASLSNNQLQGPSPTFPGGITVDNKGNNFCADSGKPCDPRVTTLLAIAASFGYPETLAANWKGNDPCSGPWTGVVCDAQGNEILVLNFANQNLVGTISPAIAELASLNKLMLSNNNLTGPIPESLTGLKSLQVVDVSNNDLWGKEPEFGKSVTVKLSGNPRIGTLPPPGSPETPQSGGGSGGTPGSSSSSSSSDDGHGDPGSSAHKSKSYSSVIVGAVVSILVLGGCVAGFLYYRHQKKKHPKPFKPIMRVIPPKQLSDDQLKIGILQGTNGAPRNELFSQSSTGERALSTNIPIEELRRATGNFGDANIIGQGGFGVVYKGEYNGTIVAIKRCDSASLGKTTGTAEFEAEVHVLQKTRHRHLVSFLGYCRHYNEKLLVYEFMPEGTLGQHLFEKDSGKYCALNWRHRLVIALDVARGVEYLHGLAQESFIHRDLKPSNILLCNDLRAKVSDFGLVKLADKEKSMMTRLAGTFGYLAPEYALTGKVSTKVDVYAYGVILMELITGRKVLDESLGEEDSNLVMAFRRYISSKGKFMSIVDASLDLDAKAYESVLQVSQLACHCTAREPNQRPTMGYAVQVLSPLVDQWVPSSSSHYEEDSNTSLTQELSKWQSDSDTFTTTFRGRSGTNHY